MVNKFNGEVDAKEFGKGFTIRLNADGQARLETEHGDPDRIGLFLVKIQHGLAALSSIYIKSFLSASLRDETGEVVKELPEIPPPLDVIGRKCLDAFALFRYGKDHETWVAENEKKRMVEAASANPTKGTEA